MAAPPLPSRRPRIALPPGRAAQIHLTAEMDYDQVNGSSNGKKLYSEM